MLKTLRNIFIIIPLLGVFFISAYVYLLIHEKATPSYQEGYLQKLSKKGFICKTWEGELGIDPELGLQRKFLFSIRDDDVARKVQEHIGKPVHLEYQVLQGIRLFGCLGDTPNIVTGITHF